MKKKGICLGIRVLVAVVFGLMLGIRIFTNFFKTNGISLGGISNLNSNLFLPTSFTFLFWEVVNFALFAFVIYFLFAYRTIEENKKEDLYIYVAIGFAFSEIANIAWIFSWYYGLILLSMICIGILLLCVCFIDLRIRKEELDTEDIIFLRVPFSLYSGWIMFIAFVNATLFMQNFLWDGFGVTNDFWTILLICFTAIFTLITIISGRDPAYGIVILWAFIGILIKHISLNGFKGFYSDIIVEVIVCMCIFTILILYYLLSGNSYTKRITEEFEEEDEETFDFLKHQEDIDEEDSIKHWVK